MNYVKTYLITCALMGSTLSLHSAEMSPAEAAMIAESIRLAEERENQAAIAESLVFEESRRSAAKPKSPAPAARAAEGLTPQERAQIEDDLWQQALRDSLAPVTPGISPQEQLKLDLALACSASEAEAIAAQERIFQQIQARNEQDKKEREHKAAHAKSRHAQEENDRVAALQAQEQFDRETAKEMIERERKRQEELATQAAIARIQQEDADHKAAQELKAQLAAERKREQERKAAEDKKQREAAERKREAEHPIAGFATITYQVHPQTGASCGLHAIDNGNKAYQCLIKGESPAGILKQPLSAPTGAVKERDMLDQIQIAHIGHRILGMDEASFTILPNFLQSKDEFLQPFPHTTETTYLPRTLGTAVHALRTQPRATHVFVIANARIVRNDNGALEGQDDHWIAIVADKKDGIITLHYMDTGGGPNPEFTKALEEIITRGNYYGMQLAILLETINLRTIQRAINDGAYRISLNALKERVDLAHKGGLVNNPRFPKEEIAVLLRQIEFEAGEPYAAQAQELLNKLR